MSTVLEGMLFDVQQRDDDLLLWIRDDAGCMHPCMDRLYPSIFVEGPAPLVEKLTRRLQVLRVLAEDPCQVDRIHFYTNQAVRVTQYVFSRPSFLQTIHRKLYALFERLEIYHSDIEAPTLYLFEKGLIPTGRVRVQLAPGSGTAIPHVAGIESLEDTEAFDYEAPNLRMARLSLTGSHRFGVALPNLLRFQCGAESIEISPADSEAMLHGLNAFLDRRDPDVVLSEYGDRTIFPALFRLSREIGIPLHFDRLPSKRRLVTEGKSYFTYGSMIFRAASYPLTGRWHVDVHNSFVHRESGMDGLVQLARMSRIPVQRMARVSTGAAMTSIQIGVALRLKYLIPWQKSHREQPRTALELLESDKGGLVFEPEIRERAAYEQVAQIDFSQMYPTIMVHHNISPETILCSCCRKEERMSRGRKDGNQSRSEHRLCDTERVAACEISPEMEQRRKDRGEDPFFVPEPTRGFGTGYRMTRPVWVDCDVVPEANFPICRRRRGIVPVSLEPILHLRRYLKQRKKNAATEDERRRASERQDALKWLLVTCFGYLGYRNAKFGRLESHESVTAFGRRAILRAKEISEDAGYHVLHAITDCLFVSREGGFSEAGILDLCTDIGRQVNIEMALEGIYSWIVFLAARSDERLPVANRYFGRFQDGSLKIRGIQARRRDTPPWIRKAQEAFLEIMKTAPDLKTLRSLQSAMDSRYRRLEGELVAGSVPWRDLLLRRTVSRSLEEYTSAGASSLSLEQLAEEGIQLQPGEKVRYLIHSKGNRDRRSRYLTEERATKEEEAGVVPRYDARAYTDLLREAYREVWGVFAPVGYFRMLRDGQLRLPYRG